jgi:hypothetical protein
MRNVRSLGLVASILFFATVATPESLPGVTGSAQGDGNLWASSWLDLSSPTNFKKGQVLRITLQGDAENVVVRLLPVTSAPTSSDGIVGSARKVPDDKVLIVKLESDHQNVKQISVHSGHSAWGIPLGGNNGVVTIVSIDRGTR